MKKQKNIYPNLFILSKWYLITKLATPVTILISAFTSWIMLIYLYSKKQRTLFSWDANF